MSENDAGAAADGDIVLEVRVDEIIDAVREARAVADDGVVVHHRRRAVADAGDVVELDVQLLHQIDGAVDTE